MLCTLTGDLLDNPCGLSRNVFCNDSQSGNETLEFNSISFGETALGGKIIRVRVSHMLETQVDQWARLVPEQAIRELLNKGRFTNMVPVLMSILIHIRLPPGRIDLEQRRWEGKGGDQGPAYWK